MKFQGFIAPHLFQQHKEKGLKKVERLDKSLTFAFSHYKWSSCQDNTQCWRKIDCENCKWFQQLKISKGQPISAKEIKALPEETFLDVFFKPSSDNDR